MPRNVHSRDITGQLIMLGTGTSVGVPTIGCGCDVCTSDDPRNRRTRCGLALGLPEGNLLVDTPPDLREQLLREGIGLVHSVLYTHEHADHIFGLDDLRLMQFYLGGPVRLYCEEKVEQRIRKAYDYAFADPSLSTHSGAVPKLEVERIGLEPFDILGQHVVPLRLEHGPRFEVLGFRFGNVAYCTDTSRIPPESMALLEGLDVLILDCLRHEAHVTHFGVAEAVDIAEQLKPKQAYLTHMSHELDYARFAAELPDGVAPAYDGLAIPLT